MIIITKSLSLADNAVQERFVRASGSGGQNVHKEASAVELRLDVRRSSLPTDVQERLIALGGKHVNNRGVLTVGSRAFRSQVQNRAAARTRLVALLRRAATPPKPRKLTRPGSEVRESRLAEKKFQGAVKRTRSRAPSEGA